MSRAFVKESDDGGETLPERPISAAPNLVTREGLAAIESEIAHLTDEIDHAGDDRSAKARFGRDLRYWTARRGNAQLIEDPGECSAVRFGCTVTIDRDDGRRQTFRIVGEDEADPERGTLSHASPLARALMGREIGDSVRVGDGASEIVAIG